MNVGMINSSRLRNMITIEVNTPTVTGQGDRVDAWTTRLRTFAEIAPLTGNEYYQAQQFNAEISVRITIRYVDVGIIAKDRIRYGAHTYEIVSPPVNTGMRFRELVMMCKEVFP